VRGPEERRRGAGHDRARLRDDSFYAFFGAQRWSVPECLEPLGSQMVAAAARDALEGSGALYVRHGARRWADTEAVCTYESIHSINSRALGRGIAGLQPFS
jgi:hypothetical protein